MGHGQSSTGCRVESLLSGVGCHAWVLLLRLLLLVVRLGLRFVPQLLTELSGVRLSLLPPLLTPHTAPRHVRTAYVRGMHPTLLCIQLAFLKHRSSV